jgi:nicotinamide-nucleotide amidase
VCIEVARLMAQGALRHSPAHVSVAVTGVAGPEPDEDGNPVGYLCLASARNGTGPIELECRLGDIGRDQIIEIAVERALSLLERVMRASQ